MWIYSWYMRLWSVRYLKNRYKMLIPDNIRPEDCIYYNGAKVLEVMQAEKHLPIGELYVRLRGHLGMSFATLMLSLDWLFLIDCVEIRGEEVVLCS